MKGFSAIAKPLHSLTSKSAPFDWTTECEAAFQELINRLTTAPILVNPRPGEQLIMTTDASETAIGAVLSATRDGLRHPVSFGSHLLNTAQSKYSATKRELLAIVYFAQAFKFHILGTHTIFETDCRPLLWLKSFHDPPSQVARYIEILSQFRYEIRYRAGSDNRAADALSRISLPPTEHSTLGRSKIQVSLISDKIDPKARVDIDLSEETPIEITRPDDQSEAVKSTQQLAKEQMKDPALKRLYEILIEKKQLVPDQEPPVTVFYHNKRDNITLQNGVMTFTKDGVTRSIIPHHKQQEILRSVHSGATGGHRSAAKMLTVLKQSHYWKGMKYEAELFAKNCYSCGTLKKPPKRPNAALTMTGTSTRMQKISIDIVGKLPRTKRGNVFFLSVLDCFTKFAWAFPLSKITSESIADKLITNVFSVFGLPLQIQSDAGSQLIAKSVQELHHMLGIKQKWSLPWQPRCNGIVERLHRTLETAMAHWASQKPRSWDNYLSLCVWSYNVQASNSTGIAPFKLMFGANSRLPVHFIFGQPPIVEELPEFEYNIYLEEMLYQIEHQARTKLQASMQSIKDYADRKQFGKPLQQGQYVWLMKGAFEKGTRKFSRNYTGPFRVKEKLSNTTYILQSTKTPFKEFRTHFNRLKRCHLPAATLEALDTVIEDRIRSRSLEDSTLEELDHESNSGKEEEQEDLLVILQPPSETEVAEAITEQPMEEISTPTDPELRRSARLASRPQIRYNVNCVTARRRRRLFW